MAFKEYVDYQVEITDQTVQPNFREIGHNTLAEWWQKNPRKQPHVRILQKDGYYVSLQLTQHTILYYLHSMHFHILLIVFISQLQWGAI